MSEGFYRAFEDKHRGSRELIKGRVEVYLPFVLPLKKMYPHDSGLDIGCGRGEWLELLKENNIPVIGVDFDEGMLKACRELNLNIELGDGIEYLGKLKDESLSVISAFHVVEHISFEELQTLVKEALRVLKSGGILILETPNPENIKVGTEFFHLDPTHIKPIPSQLLSFLPEFYGYQRTKIIKLQENIELENRENINLLDVIDGASPDYAVIAQKKANKEILEKFDDAFSNNIGLSLSELAAKFENRLQKIETKAEQAETKAEQAEAKAEQVRAELHSVYNSRSWKITEPLRWGHFQVKLLKQHGISVRLKPLLKKVTQPAAKKSMVFVNSRPALRLKLAKISRKLGFHSALKSVYLKLNTYSVSNSHNKFNLRADSLTKRPYKRSLYQPNYSGEKLSVDEILIRIRTELADSEKASNNE